MGIMQDDSIIDCLDGQIIQENISNLLDWTYYFYFLGFQHDSQLLVIFVYIFGHICISKLGINNVTK